MPNYTQHGFRGFPSLICRFGNFRCKSIFVVCINCEKKKKNTTVSRFCAHGSTTQLASCRDGGFSFNNAASYG